MQEQMDTPSGEQDAVCVTTVQGQMPPAAVHRVARALAARIDAGLDAPLCASRVLLGSDGEVHLKGGRVSRRWRAPELRVDDDDGMARTVAGDRWALGRLLLELALGSRVNDAIVDDASVERLQALKDLERRPLPPSLVRMLAELLERHPEGRAYVDGSDNAPDVEQRALARFVAAQRQPRAQRPPTAQTRPPVDTQALQKMAREMSGKVSLKSLENERTGDMPAGAILGRDDLMRLGMSRGLLPTQALPMAWPRAALAQKNTPPVSFDDCEVTVPTEIEALMGPGDAQPTPTWIATVRIEPPAAPPPPPPKTTTTTTTTTTTKAPTSTSAEATKPKTKTTSPDAKTTKSRETAAPALTPEQQRAARAERAKRWRKKVVPRPLLAAATLALALLGAAVGVAKTQKMMAPATPLIFER